MTVVGIIPNPASGKDIRRLVAHGSVFDNQEKVRIVRRVLAGLAAVEGVEEVCYMPDYFGIVARAVERIKLNFPVRPVDMTARHGQDDSTLAARIMEDRGVACIVTLGGDGTNRAVVKGCSRTPLLPISTGTNNVFPSMVEATIAGLSAGLVATGLTAIEESTIRSTMLEVLVDGKTVDLALVDAVVCDDPFIGSRAVWDMSTVRQIFLNRAAPDSIGLSSIGGVFHPVKPDEPVALCLELAGEGQPVTAAVAPGMIQTVNISGWSLMQPGQAVEIKCIPSVLALDGERELDIKKHQTGAIRVVRNGPVVIVTSKTMRAAMERRIFGPEKIPA